MSDPTPIPPDDSAAMWWLVAGTLIVLAGALAIHPGLGMMLLGALVIIGAGCAIAYGGGK